MGNFFRKPLTNFSFFSRSVDEIHAFFHILTKFIIFRDLLANFDVFCDLFDKIWRLFSRSFNKICCFFYSFLQISLWWRFFDESCRSSRSFDETCHFSRFLMILAGFLRFVGKIHVYFSTLRWKSRFYANFFRNWYLFCSSLAKITFLRDPLPKFLFISQFFDEYRIYFKHHCRNFCFFAILWQISRFSCDPLSKCMFFPQ